MITSVHNDHVKAILRLRRRRERDRTGTYLIEGYRELRRAVPAVALRTVYYCPPLWTGRSEAALLADADTRGATLVELAEAPFRRVSVRDGPGGLLGIATQSPAPLERLTLEPDPLLLVVEAIEKPGNLGTMFRTADAAGVCALILCDPVTDLFNPGVIRASIGSVFSVPFAVTATTDASAWLHRYGVTPLVATPAGGRPPWAVDLTGPRAVVVGSERRGLSGPWLATAPRVRIPMAGAHDSLNVAMAAGMILFEAVRQRTLARDGSLAHL